MDAPAGVTQKEGHTGLLHLPSAVLALIFIAKRIQPSFSLVNRQVELHFCMKVGYKVSCTIDLWVVPVSPVAGVCYVLTALVKPLF